MSSTMQVEVTYGQDTACYYTETLDIPAGMSEQDLRTHLKERAIHVANDEDAFFDPEYDFSNLRVVNAFLKKDGKRVMLVEDMGVEPRYHDSGLLLSTAIKDRNPSVFFEAAHECGKTQDEAIAALVEMAEKVKEDMHG